MPEAPEGALGTDLVAVWPEFVDCRARLRTLLPFLTAALAAGSRVIDLAAGIGCEAAALAELGFDVTANEVNPALRSHARQRIGHRKSVTWTTCDWRTIAEDLQPLQFDGLLLLGNSFCLLQDAGERRRSLKEFAALAARHSVFIVDVRNFDYILTAREAILNGAFRYSRRVMYCGNEITGRPTVISPSLVTFGYFDATGRKHGTLDMAPLLLNDLVEACIQAGFRDVEIFSDFNRGVDDTADFFTCVCRR